MPAHFYFPEHQKLNITKYGALSFKELRDKYGIEYEIRGWGDRLAPLYKLMTFITRWDLIRWHWQSPTLSLTMWSHLIGTILTKIPGMARPIKWSMEAFYPNKSRKQIKNMVKASCVNFINLFLDLMFRLPLAAKKPLRKMFSFDTQEHLDKIVEVAKKRDTGVIILVVHTGDVLNCIPGFTTHPTNYKVTSIANYANSSFYQYIVNTPDFDNLKVFPSTEFKKIGKYLVRFINEGYLCIIYQDYSNKKQLRVPMIEGKFPYLIHTSQSAQALFKKTDAEILPVITLPRDGRMGNTMFKVLDNTEIMKVAHKYRDAPSKEFHGRLSMAINKSIYPWLRAYAHVWEEVTNLAIQRIADDLKFYNVTIPQKEMIEEIFRKMEQIIDNSWEPDRDDETLLKLIKKYSSEILSALTKPNKEFTFKKEKIDLSKVGAVDELLILIRYMQQMFEREDEKKALEFAAKFETEIKS